jgi:hypothetical protein
MRSSCSQLVVLMSDYMFEVVVPQGGIYPLRDYNF